MIPSSLLRALERFFGASFSRMRLEIGSPLPALVGAEAVAWNHQIWLADSAPDSSLPDTVRTLAHEFAHICQQRAAPDRPAFPVRVGEVEDPVEEEAEACARFSFGPPMPGPHRSVAALQNAVTEGLPIREDAKT